MAKMVKREECFLYTIAWREDGGRPRNVYCTRSIPHRFMQHEITGTMLTHQFLLAGAEVETGILLPLDCDRVIRYDGKTFHLDVDMGTEGLSIIRKKIQKWAKCQDFVLFATTSEERMRNVMREARGVSQVALFTVIPWAIRDPFGPVWIDCTGLKVALPKPSTKTSSETIGK